MIEPGETRVREVFEEAVSLPPEDHRRFLDEQCGSDRSLRDQVEKLLRWDAAAGQEFLENSPASLESSVATSRQTTGTRIGAYILLEAIGEGGFGEVWTAEQRAPLRRRVALKIIKAGMDTKEVLARFEVERQALALMDHPHVAKIFDAGQTETGRPYFVMEHVPGLPITDYCDTQRLPISRRLELFMSICQAVQHAHQKGIIHRDLKPSNILVTLVDGKPVPKVIDFGIAKATAAPLTELTLYTEIGRLMGTPEYMSPEQAGSSALDVDTRADVYSLGVILYQLLTGTLPFEPKTLRNAGYDGLARIIRETEPARPSTRLSTLRAELVNQNDGVTPKEIAARRDTDFALLQRQLRSELDWIVMKCLEKERDRRYQSAAELAQDIRRYLNNDTVAARPPSLVYQVRVFARRNQALVGALAAVFAVLLGATSVSMSLYLKAETAVAKATAINDFLVNDMLASADPKITQGRKFTVDEVLENASERIDTAFPDQPETEASIRTIIGKTYISLGLYDPAEVHLRAAEVLRTRELGTKDPQTLRSRSNLADLLRRQGKYEQSEKLLRRTLEIQRRVLGDDHTDKLVSMNRLGVVLGCKGEYSEAEALHRATLQIRRRLLGDEHRDALASMTNLSIALYGQGKYPEAERLFRQTLKMNRRLLRDEHPDTLGSITNLGNVLESQGKYVEAERLHREALETKRRILGDEHPRTVLSMTNLGNFHKSQRKYTEAEELYREALEINRRVRGDEHPQTRASASNLGFLLSEMGKLEEAMPYYRKALERFRREQGDEHPITVDSINSMGALLNELGRHDDAEQLLRKGEPAARRVWAGDDARWLGNYLAKLGEARIGQEAFPQAESTLLEAYALLSAGFGDDHKRTRDTVNRLIKLYESWHAANPGKGYAEKAAEWRAKLPTEKAAEATPP